ncbi:MAG: DMT family transporter [Deinococcota bacterium]|uniref:DMT family transporter n=1 Tax=Allomeiothermus silvanus TaxID=52022 RepID=UPI00236BC85D|nr:EamA family transporter [Allomeiothermus silvanus]MCL6567660.1 EamA family transporter [Allomeiothermus silvanus]
MDARALIATLLTLIPWASAFPGIRAGLEGYSPGHLTLLRFLVASIVLVVYALVVRMPLPERKDWPAIFGLSLLGIFLYHTALNYGEVTVASGPAALLIACGPVFTALFSSRFAKERISPWGWLGIAIAFTGVALIALGQEGRLEFAPGALLILLAALSTSIYFVFQRPLLRKYNPLHFTAYTIWAGTLPMLIFLPGFWQELHTAKASATLSVIYLGVFPGALAYLTWTYALSRAPASQVTSFLYVNPVIAAAIAYFWLGEVPTSLTIIGGAIALAGVVVVNTLGKVSTAQRHPLKQA